MASLQYEELEEFLAKEAAEENLNLIINGFSSIQNAIQDGTKDIDQLNLNLIINGFSSILSIIDEYQEEYHGNLNLIINGFSSIPQNIRRKYLIL